MTGESTITKPGVGTISFSARFRNSSAASIVFSWSSALRRHIIWKVATDVSEKNTPSSLPVFLYGGETWSLTLREEHKLTVSENRVLRIFDPKREEVTGDWRKLHNDELHNLYSSPNIFRMFKSRRMRWARHVARMGAKRNTYRILVEKPEETTRKTKTYVGG
jgi:hypothetical protein